MRSWVWLVCAVLLLPLSACRDHPGWKNVEPDQLAGWVFAASKAAEVQLQMDAERGYAYGDCMSTQSPPLGCVALLQSMLVKLRSHRAIATLRMADLRDSQFYQTIRKPYQQLCYRGI